MNPHDDLPAGIADEWVDDGQTPTMELPVWQAEKRRARRAVGETLSNGARDKQGRSATVSREVALQAQRDVLLEQVRALNLALEELLAERDGTAAPSSGFGRALMLSHQWPFTYADIRKALRTLGPGAKDPELWTWLKRHATV